MSFRPVKSRVIGALSIAYGVLLGLFWAWALWTGGGTPGGGELRGVALLRILLLLLAPVLVVVAGCGLVSARVAGPDARALKGAAVVVLAVKAVVAGYWAVGLISASGAFGGLLHAAGWQIAAVEVAPSAVWAVVLALAPIPTAAPPARE